MAVFRRARNRHTFSAVDAKGAVVRRDCVAIAPEAIAKWLKRHCAGLTRVVLETGQLSTKSAPNVMTMDSLEPSPTAIA